MVFFIYVLFVEKSLFLKYVIYPIIIFLKILNINGDDTMSDFEGVCDTLYIPLSEGYMCQKYFLTIFMIKLFMKIADSRKNAIILHLKFYNN